MAIVDKRDTVKKDEHRPAAKLAGTTGESTKAMKGNADWNTMSHLYLKRFADDDPTLTAGARRNRAQNPYVALAEIDPSGRSKCKLCGNIIAKNNLRFGLMVECHKGYRCLLTLHYDCFWKHPETQKLSFEEIFMKPGVTMEQTATIQKQFKEYDSKQKGTNAKVES